MMPRSFLFSNGQVAIVITTGASPISKLKTTKWFQKNAVLLPDNTAGPARRPLQGPVPAPPQARLFSNKTHYSPTDPDARIYLEPGKARALNYLCNLAIDTAQDVISHV